MVTFPTFGKKHLSGHVLTLTLGLPDPFWITMEEPTCPATGVTEDTGGNVWLVQGPFDPRVEACVFDSWQTLSCLLYTKEKL